MLCVRVSTSKSDSYTAPKFIIDKLF